MTLNEALTKLHRAIADDSAGFPEALAVARERSGVFDENVPAYLPRAIVALAEGTVSGEPIVDSDQRGFGWLLADFVDLFPSAKAITEHGRDGLAVPALGRVLVIHSDGDERWEVVPWEPPPAPPQLRVLGTFSPTPDQVQEWAYDPNVRLAAQDEDLAVADPVHVKQLISLVADRACPKRDYILSILGLIIADNCPGGGPLMVRARDLARATGDSRLATWADDLDRMLIYAGGHGPAARDEAEEIARIMLIGIRRPHLALDESTVERWWQFRARAPDGELLDCIYVHMATGTLVWARRAGVLTLSELEPYETATTRTAALGACLDSPTNAKA